MKPVHSARRASLALLDQKLECELPVKGGRVMWDLNGISRPMWNDKPARQSR